MLWSKGSETLLLLNLLFLSNSGFWYETRMMLVKIQINTTENKLRLYICPQFTIQHKVD